jgi:para-aminobenzoate synthetase / 4-amino-4-deoxychorismate lyase
MKLRHCLPSEVYALVNETPATILLEGGDSNTQEDPWTRLFTAPLHICVAYQPSELVQLFREIESALQRGYTAAGFFSYECGGVFEPKAAMRESTGGQPLAWFGIYQRSYVFDHETGGFPDDEPPELTALGKDWAVSEPASEVISSFALTEDEYRRRIDQIHEWIRAGDVYQLNFTVPWSARVQGSAGSLYAQLRKRQPARYGAFLHWQPERRILSFSPELFFRIDEQHDARRIITRPMKGTAPRGRTVKEDRAQAEWLRNDPKNCSENVMIVDLLRNDLGHIARFGTVHTEDLFAVERYPTLWQMTSTVGATLRDGVDYESIFRALFPCGSVTGAPKIRAMQLIAELEHEPRGIYTGAIGYFSPHSTVFNVAIRTLALDGSSGRMGSGGGIVIDSNAADEYQECLLKAKFLTESFSRLPKDFSLIETILWNGAFPLLDLHLDRLIDSAEYFDFSCNREEVRHELIEYALALPDNSARKVRLLMNRDGKLTIANEILSARPATNPLGRVCISPQRTDSSDRMLFHKTTHRPLYAAAFEEAVESGFDDVLFFNQHGEVTEGAISNLFVEKSGRLLTPPLDCGVLAGVYRRHLFETRHDVQEQILHEADLRDADAIYLANAVRGLRRVSIEWTR